MNTDSLKGKTVAVSGSTGGIGKELCRYIAELGASIVLLDRSPLRSDKLKNELLSDYPEIEIKQISLDLEDIGAVKRACDELEKVKLFALVLNAGAYSIPRHKCNTGYDNVFSINFISPYYMARRLCDHIEDGGRVVAVSSIAHNYSKADFDDIDFGKRKKASLVYGNAKRYLTYALFEFFKNKENVKLSVVHPGITFTGITNHYPKLIFAIIKNPMKVIFMKPKKACLSVLHGLFSETESRTWIGPRLFDIWGFPKKKKLCTATLNEQSMIFETAERVMKEIEKNEI